MTDLEKLRAFAKAVMEAWPEGDVDGGELQEMAIKFGLLEAVEMQAPCEPLGECFCIEYYSEDEFPITCYRKTKLLEGE